MLRLTPGVSTGAAGSPMEAPRRLRRTRHGPNDVRADLRLMIWSALREHNIEMPFPQREVTIVSGGSQGG